MLTLFLRPCQQVPRRTRGMLNGRQNEANGASDGCNCVNTAYGYQSARMSVLRYLSLSESNSPLNYREEMRFSYALFQISMHIMSHAPVAHPSHLFLLSSRLTSCPSSKTLLIIFTSFLVVRKKGKCGWKKFLSHE